MVIQPVTWAQAKASLRSALPGAFEHMGMAAPQLNEALSEYLDECCEMLERLGKSLNTIEKGNASKDVLASVYRDMHTIKGSSQLFGFSQIGHLAHAMETCLDPVRKGKMTVPHDMVDRLYDGCDIITNLLAGIRENKHEPNMNGALTKLLPRLIAMAEASITGSLPPSKDKEVPLEDQDTVRRAKPVQVRLSSELVGDAGLLKVQNSHPVIEASVTIDQKSSVEIPGFSSFDDPVEPAAPAAPAKPVAVPPPTAKPVAAAAKDPAVPAKAEVKPASEDPHSDTIRVHVTLLDSLMNLVGELVLIRNQLLQHSKSNDEDTEFLKMGQRLNVVTAELQNEVMKTRMQPIGNVLNKFTRVVRDMGRDLGKKIDIELVGTETELDKTIIEAVKDPLTHIVRNAVDHAIESAEERKKLGKSETGLIRLKAYHESGQVIIEIADDGRGLSRERLGTKAIEKGLITKDAFTNMSDREVQALIFAPGFSTAAAVSNISGRGVGMDVVKTNVEKIGGVVDLASTEGVGTTIKIKIPLTLAIVPALIVRAGGQRYAIPQAKLVELLRIEGNDGDAEQIESLQGKPVLRLRGKLLPIVSLTEVLRTQGVQVNAAPTSGVGHPSEDHASNIVILSGEGLMFGMIVDEIDDSTDIVVKSLSPFLKDLTIFSGATIMGDGSVALTIDVTGISTTANLVGEAMDAGSGMTATDRKSGARRAESCEFLLIDVGATGSYAIPLSLVSRIEMFDQDRFERSGEQKVVRYRDALLPVFSLPEFLHLPDAGRATAAKEGTSVVVIKRGDRSYGIEVCDIQDIVELAARIDQTVKDRPGILGTIIAQEKVIVVVDIFGMIDQVKARLEMGSQAPGATAKVQKLSNEVAFRRNHRILVVEDSAFFRNYTRQILEDAGYAVEVAEDGADGLSLFEGATPTHFSLILSDIEMPVMDGYELARKVRVSKANAKIPMVAITTKFSVSDAEVGEKAGFSKYLEKLDPDKLIKELDDLLGRQEGGAKRAANS